MSTRFIVGCTLLCFPGAKNCESRKKANLVLCLRGSNNCSWVILLLISSYKPGKPVTATIYCTPYDFRLLRACKRYLSSANSARPRLQAKIFLRCKLLCSFLRRLRPDKTSHLGQSYCMKRSISGCSFSRGGCCTFKLKSVKGRLVDLVDTNPGPEQL